MISVVDQAYEALSRYVAAVADRDCIGAVEWRRIATDLCDAADALESAGGSVEQQVKLRNCADHCAVLGDKASRSASQDRIVNQWEYVNDESGDRVRRIAGPGGWLYQVEISMESNRFDGPTVSYVGWSQPVFVPTPTGGTS